MRAARISSDASRRILPVLSAGGVTALASNTASAQSQQSDIRYAPRALGPFFDDNAFVAHAIWPSSSLKPFVKPTTTAPKSNTTPTASSPNGIADRLKEELNWAGGRLMILGAHQVYSEHYKLPHGFYFAPILRIDILEPKSYEQDPSLNYLDATKSRWVQMGTILETGNGLKGTIPVGAGFNFSGGVGFKGLLEMRMRFPIQYAWFPPKKEDANAFVADKLSKTEMALPVSAEEARRIKVGMRYEVNGEGTAFCNAGIGAGEHASFGPFTAGAEIGASARSEVSGQLRLNFERVHISVYQDPRVDRGARIMRIGLKKVAATTSRAEANAFLGVTARNGSLVPANRLPGIGKGLVWDICERHGVKGDKGLEGFIEKFTYTGIANTTEFTDAETDDDTFLINLDVTNPVGQEAINEALRSAMRLDFTGLYRLAEANRITPDHVDAGVKWASHHRRATTKSASSQVRILGQMLLDAEINSSNTSGIFTDSRGQELVYQVNEETRKYFSFIRGGETATWRTFLERRGEAQQYAPSLDVRVESDDRDTHGDEAKMIFHLADLAGSPLARAELTRQTPALDALDHIKSLASDWDNTVRKVNLRFTPEGIERLIKTTHETRLAQYFAYAKLADPDFGNCPIFHSDNPALQSMATRIIDGFLKYWDQPFWDFGIGSLSHCLKSPMRLATEELAEAYRNGDGGFPGFGRDLKKDALLYDAAVRFSNAIEGLKEDFETIQDPKLRAQALAARFSEMGSRSESYNRAFFNFNAFLGAMITLCGDAGTHVGELSIVGKDINFRFSEGTLRSVFDEIDDGMAFKSPKVVPT